jgi:hypothetical protein
MKYPGQAINQLSEKEEAIPKIPQLSRYMIKILGAPYPN